MNHGSPMQGLQNRIIEQKEKENNKNIWENSKLSEITNLTKNNVGIVGESFMQDLCDKSSIDCNIDGTKTKQIGGGEGDGVIKDKSLEIKTAYQGCGTSGSFQHELAEFAWKATYVCFIDISPQCIYVTIFPNWSKEFYEKSGKDNTCKCIPYFPTRSICRRKKEGNYKLDTTVAINETNVKKGLSVKVTNDSTYDEIANYINKIIQ